MYASSAVNDAPAATVAPARLSVTEMPDGVGAAVGTGAATGASVGLGAGASVGAGAGAVATTATSSEAPTQPRVYSLAWI